MRKRSRTKATTRRDENQTAFDAVQRVIELSEGAAKRTEKNPAAVALGRRGGLKGGRALAEKLTPAERRASATRAARARWGNAREDK